MIGTPCELQLEMCAGYFGRHHGFSGREVTGLEQLLLLVGSIGEYRRVVCLDMCPAQPSL